MEMLIPGTDCGTHAALVDYSVADEDAAGDEHIRDRARQLDRLLVAGVHFGCAVADAGYGAGATFHRGLAKRVALWAVGIPKAQTVYSAAVTVSWPPAAPTGRRRRHGIPSELPITVEAALADVKWRQIRWRRGTKGPLTARFAARRVRVADGPQAQNGRRLPGEAEVWLVGGGGFG